MNTQAPICQRSLYHYTVQSHASLLQALLPLLPDADIDWLCAVLNSHCERLLTLEGGEQAEVSLRGYEHFSIPTPEDAHQHLRRFDMVTRFAVEEYSRGVKVVYLQDLLRHLITLAGLLSDKGLSELDFQMVSTVESLRELVTEAESENGLSDMEALERFLHQAQAPHRPLGHTR